MSDWDAELSYAQAEELKFFSKGSWTPYREAQKWRRRFWFALAVIVGLGAVILRGCA
jgi:hypothetical protein